MSQENVGIVRGLIEAFNKTGDREAAYSLLDPKIEFEVAWRSGRDAPDFRVHRGLDEVRTVLEELMAPSFATWSTNTSTLAMTWWPFLKSSRVRRAAPQRHRRGALVMCARCAPARSCASKTFPTQPKPSKPQGFRSRRCRSGGP